MIRQFEVHAVNKRRPRLNAGVQGILKEINAGHLFKEIRYIFLNCTGILDCTISFGGHSGISLNFRKRKLTQVVMTLETVD